MQGNGRSGPPQRFPDRNVGAAASGRLSSRANPLKFIRKQISWDQARELHFLLCVTLATMTTSCFQIDPIDVQSPRFNSPVVVVAFDDEGHEQVQPSTLGDGL